MPISLYESAALPAELGWHGHVFHREIRGFWNFLHIVKCLILGAVVTWL